MFVWEVNEFSEEIYRAVCELVPQLGSHKFTPSRDELVSLIESKTSTLLAARYPHVDSDVAGILTILIYRVPTGIRSLVEDVIVDAGMRRRGVAKALLNKAIEIAQRAGASGVALTSNYHRVEANLLYQSMGFTKRETNAYFYELK